MKKEARGVILLNSEQTVGKQFSIRCERAAGVVGSDLRPPPQWYHQSCWQQQQAYPATSPEAPYPYQHYTPYLGQDPPLHGKTYTLS